MTDRSAQISGVAGILFVVTFVIGVLAQGDVPIHTDGGEEIAAWFADNGEQYLIGDFITGIAIVLFYFPFLAGLYTTLRRAEGDAALFSRVSLFGGILFPVAGLAGGISLAAVAVLEGDVSADLAAYSAALSYHGFSAVSGVAAIMMGGAAVVMLTKGAFWTWLGWLGAVLAAIGFVASASSIENDPEGVLSLLSFVTFIGLGVWILATSVGMLRAKETAATGA